MAFKLPLWGDSYRTWADPLSMPLTDLSFLRVLLVSEGVYHKERIGHFSVKIKMLFGGAPPPPHLPWKKIKLWYLIRVPDVCMYLFIWIFIVFSVKQFASLGAFQKFKKHTWQSHKDQSPVSYELFAALSAIPENDFYENKWVRARPVQSVCWGAFWTGAGEPCEEPA